MDNTDLTNDSTNLELYFDFLRSCQALETHLIEKITALHNKKPGVLTGHYHGSKVQIPEPKNLALSQQTNVLINMFKQLEATAGKICAGCSFLKENVHYRLQKVFSEWHSLRYILSQCEEEQDIDLLAPNFSGEGTKEENDCDYGSNCLSASPDHCLMSEEEEPGEISVDEEAQHEVWLDDVLSVLDDFEISNKDIYENNY